MRNTVPGDMHAVIVRRVQDDAIGLFYARDPSAWLAAIAAHFQLHESEIRATPEAPRAIANLRRRFAMAHVPSDALPWYLIDFRQAVAALDEIDVATGEPKRLPIDAPVMLMPDRSRGRVIGFSRCGRVIVKLDSARLTENLVIAPCSQIKPILRAAAL